MTVNIVLLLSTEIENGSSTGGGVILGGVLGVLIFVAMAVIIAISAILYLIEKGTYNNYYFKYDISPVHWMPYNTIIEFL